MGGGEHEAAPQSCFPHCRVIKTGECASPFFTLRALRGGCVGGGGGVPTRQLRRVNKRENVTTLELKLVYAPTKTRRCAEEMGWLAVLSGFKLGSPHHPAGPRATGNGGVRGGARNLVLLAGSTAT